MNTSLPPLKFDPKRFAHAKTCPCGKSNRDGKFSPYKGFEDKGYCHGCEQTFLPERPEAFMFNPTPRKQMNMNTQKPAMSTVSPSVLKASMTGYEQNVLVQWLASRFGENVTEQLVSRYLIGSAKGGQTVFWQIDGSGQVRGGKLMKYDETGHRLKDVPPTWAHTAMGLNNFHLHQCFFGLHLTRGNSHTVSIVESEKSACIASLYYPQCIWLGCGGKDGLKDDKFKALQGRRIILFPDLDGYDLWRKRCKELSPSFDITVSELLHRVSNEDERNAKLDIADYLLRFNPLDQISFEHERTAEYDGAGCLVDPVKGFPTSWDIALPKATTIDMLVERFKCEEYQQEPTEWIDTAQFLSKPVAMPMLSVDDYRKNNWRADSSPDKTNQ